MENNTLIMKILACTHLVLYVINLAAGWQGLLQYIISSSDIDCILGAMCLIACVAISKNTASGVAYLSRNSRKLF